MSYYNKTGVPNDGANVESRPIRNEFSLIEEGFDKFPLLEADKILRVNSDESGIELINYTDVSQLSGFGKNKIINGNFDIWQRGTSQTSSGYGSADRWYIEGAGTLTASKQSVSVDGELIPALLLQEGSGGSNNAAVIQRIESVTSLAGKSAVLTFYARESGSNTVLRVSLIQNFGSGGSAAVSNIGLTSISVTSTVTKYTLNFTIPSINAKTIGANSYLGVKFEAVGGTTVKGFYLARVDFKEGTLVTPFEQRFIGEEWELCQRYYWRGLPALTLNAGVHAINARVSWQIRFPVKMRTIPVLSKNTTGQTLSALGTETFDSPSQDAAILRYTATSSNVNANVTFLSTNYFAADAEI